MTEETLLSILILILIAGLTTAGLLYYSIVIIVVIYHRICPSGEKIKSIWEETAQLEMGYLDRLHALSEELKKNRKLEGTHNPNPDRLGTLLS